MSFAENCIRGIPNRSYLTDEGSVGSHLFSFNKAADRGDGWAELSINWEDDDCAIEFTLSQRKADGGFQFKGGAVVIPRPEVDRLNNRPTIRKGLVSYERQPLADNPYHGNILLRANTSKPTMRLIAAGLALAVSRIVPQKRDSSRS
ncbi:MAG TPA: hypothetical protein EYP19_09695 [Desulfobacterales bacterium]|nr:hypothetical protein [Desulfobacterales bacterium]